MFELSENSLDLVDEAKKLQSLALCMAHATDGQLFSCVSPTVREYVLWLSQQPNSPAGDFVLNQLLPDRTHLFIKKGSFPETINLGHATSRTRTITYREWIREKIDRHLEDTSYRSTKERREADSKRKKEQRKEQNKLDQQNHKRVQEKNKQEKLQIQFQQRQDILRKQKLKERVEREEREQEQHRKAQEEARKQKKLQAAKPKLTKKEKAIEKRKKEAAEKRKRDDKESVEQQKKDKAAAGRNKRLKNRK